MPWLSRREYHRLRRRRFRQRVYNWVVYQFRRWQLPLGVLCLMASVSAHAQNSPDGSAIVPNPQLVTRDGTWTFGPGFPGFAGFWHINLNGRSTSAGGHQMVVANGGKLYLESMSGWFVYDNGQFARADPPPTTGPTQPPETDAILLKVGPTAQYKTIASAVAVANADKSAKEIVVEIASGTYTNEFFDVTRPLMLRSGGGPVTLRATVPPPNGKGIIIAWAPLIVNGLTFTGATIAGSGNGAAIRDHNQPAGSLTVANSLFTQNDVAILTDPRAVDEVVSISNSKFVNNGLRSQHAVYFNAGRQVTITGSLFCGQLVGHDIKSRAADTEITDNELYDGAPNASLGCNAGTTSLAIDISNGGKAVISGNKIVQGPGSPQFKMTSYGGEGLIYQSNVLVITNNSFDSTGTAQSTAIYDPHCVRNRAGSRIADNTFTNIRTQIDPATCR